MGTHNGTRIFAHAELGGVYGGERRGASEGGVVPGLCCSAAITGEPLLILVETADLTELALEDLPITNPELLSGDSLDVLTLQDLDDYAIDNSLSEGLRTERTDLVEAIRAEVGA